MVVITYDNYNRPNLCGVKKKIEAQIDAFEKHYEDAYYTRFEYGIVYLCKNKNVIEKRNAVSRSEAFRCFLEWIKVYKQDKVFFRFVFPVSWYMVHFLRELKNIGVKTVLEMPTYPYEGMIQNPRVLLEDQIFREEMNGLVSLVTTYSLVDSVFGNKTVVLSNGVVLEDNPKRKVRKKDNTINLLGVSSMADNQGYDRLFAGMREYLDRDQRDYNIFCHLVGTGRNLKGFKEEVAKFGLEEYVKFYGVMLDRQLDDIYNCADIGIGALALYKQGLKSANTMKLREYCSRGLPFIYAGEDLCFKGDEEYVLKVDDSPEMIDFNEVIELYRCTVGREDIIINMRKKARDSFDWNRIMEPVFKALGDGILS